MNNQFNESRIRPNIIIIAILAFGLGLRLWSIDFGLPQIHIGDEGGLVGAAMYSGVHKLRPLRIIFGQFVPYLLLLEYGTYFIVSVLLGKYTSVNNMYVSFVRNPTELLLIGRVTMAVAGVLIVWMTYYVGKTFYSLRIGLLAAFFLSITFLSVKESHYLKEGNPAALFLLGCYYFILKIQKHPIKKNYIGAGVMAGLAIGTKFEPLIILPVLLVGHFLKNKKVALKKLGFFILGFGGAIFLTFPYLFINPQTYYQQLLIDLRLAHIEYPLHLRSKPISWWFLFVHIPQGLGLPLFVAAIIGFLISFARSRLKRNYLFIPLVPIVFIATIDYFQNIHAARYALLTLPFYALGAAVFVEWFKRFIKSEQLRPVILLLIITSISYVSWLRSIKFNTIISKPDTRFMSKDWIERNISAGKRVLVETTFRPEYQANINAPLTLDTNIINVRIKAAYDQGLPATYLETLKKITAGQIGYDLVATPRIDVAKNITTNSSTTLVDANYWKEQNVEYFVLSSWAIKPDLTAKFASSINNYYVMIKEFRPHPEFASDPHFVQMDYAVLDSIDVFSEDLIFGPVIQIYKLK